MVTPGRFELPTCGLGNRRSIHLSYGATFDILTRYKQKHEKGFGSNPCQYPLENFLPIRLIPHSNRANNI